LSIFVYKSNNKLNFILKENFLNIK
jgi:hypothetical protein